MKAPVIALLALIASGAGAQSVEDLPRALLIEAELVGGYTPVEMEKWTGTTPTASSQTSYGVNVRAYLLHIGKVRVGLQAGNQHFFKWERRTSFGSTTIVDRNTVAGFSVGIAVRACDKPRMDCNVGYGFHFLGADAIPGLNFGMSYVLFTRGRFSVPIGGRVDLLMGDGFALPVALKTGVTFRP